MNDRLCHVNVTQLELMRACTVAGMEGHGRLIAAKGGGETEKQNPKKEITINTKIPFQIYFFRVQCSLLLRFSSPQLEVALIKTWLLFYFWNESSLWNGVRFACPFLSIIRSHRRSIRAYYPSLGKGHRLLIA